MTRRAIVTGGAGGIGLGIAEALLAAGYAVTAFMQLLGVTPQLIRLDVAVPLVRRRTTCLGHVHPDYLAETQGLQPGEYTLPPVGLNLIFLQPF